LQFVLDACGKLMLKAMVMVRLHHVVVVNAKLWGINGAARNICIEIGSSYTDHRCIGTVELPIVLLGLAHA
jgi:hypothetical protein